jgi:hypothetical protein
MTATVGQWATLVVVGAALVFAATVLLMVARDLFTAAKRMDEQGRKR